MQRLLMAAHMSVANDFGGGRGRLRGEGEGERGDGRWPELTRSSTSDIRHPNWKTINVHGCNVISAKSRQRQEKIVQIRVAQW